MSKPQILLLLGFLACVVVGAVLLADFDPSGGRGGPPTAAPSGGPHPASAPGADARAAADPAGGPAAAAPREATGRLPAPLALRVLDADGRPVSRANVRVVGARAVGEEGEAVLVRRSEDAAFVGARGSAWAPVPRDAVGGRAIDVRLPRAAAPFSLRVVEADGAPAVGVPIEFTSSSPGPTDASGARTDARGVVEIDDRPAGVLRVRVGGTERAGPTLRLVLRPASAEASVHAAATATLEPGWLVTGRVVDAAGVPVRGARVAGATPEGPCGAPTRTAADGSFRLAARLAEGFGLRVEASGFESVAVEPALPSARGALLSTVEVRLAPAAARVAGRVVRPAPDARVRLELEPAGAAPLREWFGPDVAVAWTDRADVGADGAFAFEGVPADLLVRLRVRGDVAAEDHLLAPRDAGALRLVPVLDPFVPTPADERGSAEGAGASGLAGTLRGRVVDAAGRALAGCTVGALGARAVTDATGAFALEHLPPGAAATLVCGFLDGADVAGSVPGDLAPYATATATVGGPSATVVFPRAARVRFRLLDGHDDRPLSFARVVLVASDGAVRHDAFVATHAGRVELWPLAPGDALRLAALAPGLRLERRLTLDAGADLDLGDLRLASGARVEGVVADRDGRPIRGATVALVESDWIRQPGADPVHARELSLRRATTDVTGAFRIEGLVGGRRDALAAHAPGYAPATALIAWVEAGADRVALTLRPGGAVRVRVRGPEGPALSGAVVDLQSARTGVRHLDAVRRAALGGVAAGTSAYRLAADLLPMEAAGEPGEVRLGHVDPGPYEVMVVRPGSRPYAARLTVPDPGHDGVAGLPQGRLDEIVWEVSLRPEAAAPR